MHSEAHNGNTDRPEIPSLVEAAKSHLRQAFAVLTQGIVAGITLETNLASIEHRRQVEAMTPFLEAEERKAIKRFERKLDKKLKAAASVLMALDEAMQKLEQPQHAALLDDEDRKAVERLKGIVAKIQDSYLR